jgi:xanthine dehydrogenase accessory factor
MLAKQHTMRDPIEAILTSPSGAVLAVIAGVEGPSYRPVGAMMAVFPELRRVGSLSSGCIEQDIALNAIEATRAGVPRMLRYGLGSPYLDIQLPCGGGLDILLVPNPNTAILSKLARERSSRKPCSLVIEIDTGLMTLTAARPTKLEDTRLNVLIEPEIRFLVFGKGSEASTFSALVQSAGFPNLLVTPDIETAENGAAQGCHTRHITQQIFPPDLEVDDRSAIILFFHDHDWEPPILLGALKTPAFYIGAQGSQRARDSRLLVLESMGVPKEDRARLYGPIGLITSTRDAKTLAVSVLAEVLANAMAPVE